MNEKRDDKECCGFGGEGHRIWCANARPAEVPATDEGGAFKECYNCDAELTPEQAQGTICPWCHREHTRYYGDDSSVQFRTPPEPQVVAVKKEHHVLFQHLQFMDCEPKRNVALLLIMTGYEDNIAWANTGTFEDGIFVRGCDRKPMIKGLDFSHWCYLSDAFQVKSSEPAPLPKDENGDDLARRIADNLFARVDGMKATRLGLYDEEGQFAGWYKDDVIEMVSHELASLQERLKVMDEYLPLICVEAEKIFKTMDVAKVEIPTFLHGEIECLRGLIAEGERRHKESRGDA